MKISGYYKKKYNAKIELHKCGVSYYPSGSRKKRTVNIDSYDKVFLAAIFPGTRCCVEITGDNIENKLTEGGTGINIETVLPQQIENFEPDYSIYPEENISYGFITRGCIRNCYFCFVPKKEGKIHFNQHPKEIIKHKKVQFMDNNIFGYKGCDEMLEWLVANKVKYQFNQAMDIRLLTQKKADLLHKSNYWKPYSFALDDLKVIPHAERGLNILGDSGDISWPSVRFFVYCNPKHNIASDVVKRIEWVKKKGCMVYFMRDISCYSSRNVRFYNDLAAWCNQPGFFKKLTFHDFLVTYHYRKGRSEKTITEKKERLIRNHSELYKGSDDK